MLSMVVVPGVGGGGGGDDSGEDSDGCGGVVVVALVVVEFSVSGSFPFFESQCLGLSDSFEAH
jgi:hypothetical protein